MTWWAIKHADGTVSQTQCEGHPSLHGACDGGWNLDAKYERLWRDGPDRLGIGPLYIEKPVGKTFEQAGYNPLYQWTLDTVFWRWICGDAVLETDTADIPAPLEGFSVAVAIERKADLTLESIEPDGSISPDLDKHKAQAIGRIDAKAAPVLSPIEPAWKQSQHEAKRQEVHFWSSGRRTSLDSNYPIAWAEVRRKYPTPSLMDTDRVGDVIATYRAAMQVDLERTAPVEAWRVTSKDAIRAATTVQAVADALKNAMEGWPI